MKQAVNSILCYDKQHDISAALASLTYKEMAHLQVDVIQS